MSTFEIFLIGLGLSMDAAAVAISNGLAFADTRWRQLLLMPLAFGFFQGLMPLLGHTASGFAAALITRWADTIIFCVLCLIAVKMLIDGLFWEAAPIKGQRPALTNSLILLQAIATSIDAFAVGIGFGAAGTDILPAALSIALTTTTVSLLALAAAKSCGALLESQAQMLGGFILLFIAVKAIC